MIKAFEFALPMGFEYFEAGNDCIFNDLFLLVEQSGCLSARLRLGPNVGDRVVFDGFFGVVGGVFLALLSGGVGVPEIFFCLQDNFGSPRRTAFAGEPPQPVFDESVAGILLGKRVTVDGWTRRLDFLQHPFVLLLLLSLIQQFGLRYRRVAQVPLRLHRTVNLRVARLHSLQPFDKVFVAFGDLCILFIEFMGEGAEVPPHGLEVAEPLIVVTELAFPLQFYLHQFEFVGLVDPEGQGGRYCFWENIQLRTGTFMLSAPFIRVNYILWASIDVQFWMVRGFDPSASDISSLLFDYLVNITQRQTPLSLESSQQSVRHWLRHSPSTSLLYSQCRRLPFKPAIRLKKHCPSSQGKLGDVPSTHFSANIVGEEIVICLDNIKTSVELKQNLDRELTVYSFIAKRAQVKQDDTPRQTGKGRKNIYEEVEEETLGQALIEGCRQGYKNYFFNEEKAEKMAGICAKHLFFRRSRKVLPLDRFYRYAGKLIDDLL